MVAKKAMIPPITGSRTPHHRVAKKSHDSPHHMVAKKVMIYPHHKNYDFKKSDRFLEIEK